MTRAAAVACAAVVAGCAARAPARPAGAALPDAGAIAAFKQATGHCVGLRTTTGVLRLSGRAGSERVRGTLLAGLARPASLRVEAVAPFGQPVFILAGRDNRATLVLPRDNRVLLDEAVPDVLDRLIGLALTASDLHLLLAGCLGERQEPADGRAWPGGWRAVTVPVSSASGAAAGPPEGDATLVLYLKQLGAAPVVVAADRAAWRVDYGNHLNGWPRRVRIRGTRGRVVDLTAVVEDLEVNTGIDEAAFQLAPPPGARPMVLDDLRSVAPLRGSG